MILKNITLFLVLVAMAGCTFKEDVPPKVIEVPEKKTANELSNELLDAVLKKDYQSVSALLKAGPDLEAYDTEGSTVLIRAVQMRDPILVEMLLNAGAKPLNYQKENPSESAYSKILEEDIEIMKLFGEKILDLKNRISMALKNKDFGQALTAIHESRIPFNFVMLENSKLEDYVLLFCAVGGPGPSDLIKYLVNGREHESLNVLTHKNALLNVSNQMRDSAFYAYLIDLLVEKKLNPVDFELQSSISDKKWFAKQLETISQKGLTLDPQFFYELCKSAILLNMEKDMIGSESVYSSTLNLSLADSYKNEITNSILLGILNFDDGSKKATAIIAILSSWKNKNLQKAGFSRDVYTENIFKLLNSQVINGESYIELTKMLQDFTTDREGELTLQKIMTSSLSQSQKIRISEFTLGYLSKIPANAFAAAVQNNSLVMLNLLIESKVPFLVSEQESAIEEAVLKSKTGAIAQSFLIALKQSNIGFSNESGALALKNAIERLISQNDTTYFEVIDFLVSLPDHPINSLNETEKIYLLDSLISYSKANNAAWNTLNKILIKSNPVEKTVTFTKNIKFPSGIIEVKSSLLWAFVLHLFETKKESEDAYGNLIVILKSLVKVFSNETTSMAFADPSNLLNPNIFVSQQILPLSLLIWAGKDNVLASSKDTYSTVPSMGISLSPISLEYLTNSEIYFHLSEDKEFWSDIIEILLKNQNPAIYGSNAQSAFYLFKAFLGSGALDAFPELSNTLLNYSTPLASPDTQCRFEDTSTSGIANWTTIGSFISLESFYKKSCSGGKLSEIEANFFKEFVSRNIEGAVNSVYLDSSADSCEAVNYVVSESGVFDSKLSKTYLSDLGTPLIYKDSEEGMLSDITIMTSPFYFDRKCKTSGFNADTHKQAKLLFLKDWQKCVINNQDNLMINYMQGIDSKHGISSLTTNVKVCK